MCFLAKQPHEKYLGVILFINNDSNDETALIKTKYILNGYKRKQITPMLASSLQIPFRNTIRVDFITVDDSNNDRIMLVCSMDNVLRENELKKRLVADREGRGKYIMEKLNEIVNNHLIRIQGINVRVCKFNELQQSLSKTNPCCINDPDDSYTICPWTQSIVHQESEDESDRKSEEDELLSNENSEVEHSTTV